MRLLRALSPRNDDLGLGIFFWTYMVFGVSLMTGYYWIPNYKFQIPNEWPMSTELQMPNSKCQMNDQFPMSNDHSNPNAHYWIPNFKWMTDYHYWMPNSKLQMNDECVNDQWLLNAKFQISNECPIHEWPLKSQALMLNGDYWFEFLILQFFPF